MVTISEANTEKLLKGITIPPQPQIMVDLHMEMAMPNMDLEKISQIISKDVGLSGGVLKIVNSPFFGLRNSISSIRQALSLLGIENIVNIVNSLSIRTSLSFSDINAFTKVWDNDMDVAMTAAALAKMLGVCSPDEAYTLGLFHNSGIYLLMDKYKNYLSELSTAYANQHAPITDHENALFNTNHAVVGYFIARAWKLPHALSSAIAEHHKTDAIFADQSHTGDQKKNLLAVLKIAENTCRSHLTLGNQAIDYEFEHVKPNLLLYLGLSDYDLRNMQAEVHDMGMIAST